MKILFPKSPLERKPLLFTFDNDLEDGEAITLVVMDPVVLTGGTDPAPQAILDSAPVTLVSARQVLQWVSGGVLGADYEIRCRITGARGGVHEASCRLPVRKI